MEANTSQEWRAPLCDAMHFVSDHANAIYDRFAPPLSPDSCGALARIDARCSTIPILA